MCVLGSTVGENTGFETQQTRVRVSDQLMKSKGPGPLAQTQFPYFPRAQVESVSVSVTPRPRVSEETSLLCGFSFPDGGPGPVLQQTQTLVHKDTFRQGHNSTATRPLADAAAKLRPGQAGVRR